MPDIRQAQRRDSGVMFKRRHKFHAKPSPKGVPGYISPLNGPLPTASKAEATFYAQLDQMRAAGAIAWWLPQVSFTVGTDDSGLKRVIYRCDALVCAKSGETVALDRKGMDTPTSNAKRAAVRDRYGIRVVAVYGHPAVALQLGAAA